MLEQTSKVGATADWLTPLWSVILDWYYQPAASFSMPWGETYSSHEVQKMLKSKGIRSWGYLAVNDTVLFSVREPQADYTEYWLQRKGIAYEGGLSPKKSAMYRRRKKRQTQRRRR